MAMASTIYDGGADEVQPTTLPALLQLLGVKDKSVTKQWDPIMAWLADNQASPELWMSMLANGYALMLEQMVPSFQRPIPCRRITTASGTKANLLL